MIITNGVGITTLKNGAVVKQALDAANSTVNKGVYDATLLETVDPDLAVGNILQPVDIFGKVGTVVAGVDVSDADALVTDVKDPKTFYSVAAPRKTGTMPTVALADDNPAYPAGYHAGAANLAAVDAHLAVGNIKQGVSIFGFAGTVIAGGTETIEKYADATIAAGATYTPAASGIFFNPSVAAAVGKFNIEYYSTGATNWTRVGWSDGLAALGFTAIGDGTNFRIRNASAGDVEYCLMRQYYSMGTYERESDQNLAGGATYTPAVSGFFAHGSYNVDNYNSIWINFTTGGWLRAFEWYRFNQPVTIAIGDGANLRIKNESATAFYNVLMRAKLT